MTWVFSDTGRGTASLELDSSGFGTCSVGLFALPPAPEEETNDGKKEKDDDGQDDCDNDCGCACVVGGGWARGWGWDVCLDLPRGATLWNGEEGSDLSWG